MRRADRLLQIVQILRRRRGPTTADMLARELEVTARTIYRDVAALQSTGVPVQGEAGVGYVLAGGYDLPPRMFDAEEIEAIVLGASMVIARGDATLARAAVDVIAKVRAVVPPAAAAQMWRASTSVPHALGDAVGFGAHLPIVRRAIRQSRKLRIRYLDLPSRPSTRIVWPLGLYLFSHVTLVCTWCEQRSDFRAFRAERIETCEPLDVTFDPQNGALLREFLARRPGGPSTPTVHAARGSW